MPKEDFDIQNELFVNDQKLSGVYIIGIQEMVPLSTNQVLLGKDKKIAQVWENIIS